MDRSWRVSGSVGVLRGRTRHTKQQDRSRERERVGGRSFEGELVELVQERVEGLRGGRDVLPSKLELSCAEHVAIGILRFGLGGRGVQAPPELREVGAMDGLAHPERRVRVVVDPQGVRDVEQDLDAASLATLVDPSGDASSLERPEVVLGRAEPNLQAARQFGSRQSLGPKQVHHSDPCRVGEGAHRGQAADPNRRIPMAMGGPRLRHPSDYTRTVVEFQPARPATSLGGPSVVSSLAPPNPIRSQL